MKKEDFAPIISALDLALIDATSASIDFRVMLNGEEDNTLLRASHKISDGLREIQDALYMLEDWIQTCS